MGCPEQYFTRSPGGHAKTFLESSNRANFMAFKSYLTYVFTSMSPGPGCFHFTFSSCHFWKTAGANTKKTLEVLSSNFYSRSTTTIYPDTAWVKGILYILCDHNNLEMHHQPYVKEIRRLIYTQSVTQVKAKFA